MQHVIPSRGSPAKQPGSPCVSRCFLPLEQSEMSVRESGGSEQFLPGPLMCHLSLPGFLSLLAWHMGQGEAGKSAGSPGTGFSCSSLCCSLMSGHDSSLLIKGFLCQVN